jgi:hypothetical protein
MHYGPLLMQYLPIMHVLDAMHIERNISNNMLKHMFGKKDIPAVRRDMEAAGKFSHSHVKDVLTEEEKVEFLVLISRTKVPPGYSSTFIKHAGESCLAGLKIHDNHYLLQQILPTTMRNLGA